jgi:hypothetical protein
MDGGGREMLRIKKKKLNTINNTVLFYTDDVNVLGKSICIIAAEKHANFYSCQYGDWGKELSRCSDSLWTGRTGDRIPVWTKCNTTSRLVLVATKHPVQWASDLFPGGKDAGAWH